MTTQIHPTGGVRIDERRLHLLIDEGRRRSWARGTPTLVSMVSPIPDYDPLAGFAIRNEATTERLFWSCPSQGYELVGLGNAWATSAAGADRFAAATSAWRDLCAEAVIEDRHDIAGAGPRLIGGFAFTPAREVTSAWHNFADTRLTLPRYMITRINNTAWLTINTVV